jgi:hypothetical protein
VEVTAVEVDLVVEEVLVVLVEEAQVEAVLAEAGSIVIDFYKI